MPVTMEYRSCMDEIRMEFDKLGKNLAPVEDKIVKRMAETVATAVRKNLGRDEGKRYGHQERPHMADDVVVSNKQHLDGETTRTVGGGKKTGTLWHLVEYGTIRNHYKAKHFMENSVSETETATDKIFDEEIRKGLGVV